MGVADCGVLMFTEPGWGGQPCVIWAASQVRVRSQLLLMLLLVVLTTNGEQPVVGLRLKLGTGGASTQMVRISVSRPQMALPTTSVIVYEPGAVNCKPSTSSPEVQLLGLLDPFVWPSVPELIVKVPGLTPQIWFGAEHAGAWTPVLESVSVTVVPIHAVSVEIVNDAKGTSDTRT